jgi:hypothetical protein
VPYLNRAQGDGKVKAYSSACQTRGNESNRD